MEGITRLMISQSGKEPRLKSNTLPHLPGPALADLERIVGTLSIRDVRGGEAVLIAPWGVAIPPGTAAYYFVSQGRCVLETHGSGPAILRAGDLALLISGSAHSLRDRPGSPLEPAGLLARASRGAGASRRAAAPGRTGLTRLVFGCFEVGGQAQAALLHLLPPVVCVRGARGPQPESLGMVLALLTRELTGPAAGSPPVLEHASRILAMLALKAHLENSTQATEALNDPEILAVLRRVHEHPEAPWALSSLAREAGLSRSGFASKFAQKLGRPPMAYVHDVRMQLAAEMLAAGNASIKEIAGRTGYGSSAAFSHAFRRWSGSPPRRFRGTG
jgi:AraC family transcriptional regulator, activator of mtrCDE